jgi:hypothetical protein
VTTLRVLDLDIENRPLAYWYDGATTAEVTAIAAGFVGEKKVHCWLLGRNSAVEMLEGFRALYDQADIVTGHFLRKHDLPIINGALIEIGHKPLSAKLCSDTQQDFIKAKDISKSQENLAQMIGLAEEKTHMSNASWRQANRLTDRGLARTRARVVGDVRQHMAMRKRLIQLGLIKPPKMWRP